MGFLDALGTIADPVGIFDEKEQETGQATRLTTGQQTLLEEQTKEASGAFSTALEGFKQPVGSTFEGIDRTAFNAGIAGIDAQTERQIGNAFGSGERFSSGNRLLRARIASEGGIQKSRLLGDLLNQERVSRIQTNQFQQGQNFNRLGQVANLATSPFGVSSFENIVTPGQESALPGVLGLAGGIVGGIYGGPGGAAAGSQAGNIVGSKAGGANSVLGR